MQPVRQAWILSTGQITSCKRSESTKRSYPVHDADSSIKQGCVIKFPAESSRMSTVKISYTLS